MLNYEDSSKENCNDTNYHTLELIYENISLTDENIRLALENRKLMKRIEKARKFEELVSKVYDVEDVSYWKQRSMELQSMLKKVLPFCPTGYKVDIYKELNGKNYGV